MTLTPRFLKRSAKYAPYTPHACAQAHARTPTSSLTLARSSGLQVSGSWTWMRHGSWTLPPTSPRTLSMGRCRGWREPPDGAWTYLTFPGPELEKLQRSAVDPGGREGGLVDKCPGHRCSASRRLCTPCVAGGACPTWTRAHRSILPLLLRAPFIRITLVQLAVASSGHQAPLFLSCQSLIHRGIPQNPREKGSTSFQSS